MSQLSTESVATTKILQFQPVGVQRPLCRLYLKSPDSCPLGSLACPHLHECEDLHIPAHHALESVDDEAQMAGLPYILYHLAIGEELPFSLLRRTLDQFAPVSRRVYNVRHALLHWAPSPPSTKFASLLRSNCRILHFPFFTEFTHKHRLQACIKKYITQLKQSHPSSTATATSSQVMSAELRRSIHALDFFPTSFLLPNDRLELLALHREWGGKVHPSITEEAEHPTDERKNLKQQEKRNTKQLHQREAPEEVTTEEKEEASSTSSSTSTAASSLYFEVPDFLSAYPFHYADDASVSTSTIATAASISHILSLSSLLPPHSSPPIWILKPYNRGSGHGILITDWAENVDKKWITGAYVASEYIQRPLLINKDDIKEEHELYDKCGNKLPLPPVDIPRAPDLRKFDLRLYVMVLSPFFPPMPSAADSTHPPNYPFQIFLYTNGLARFASHTYDHGRSTSSACLGTAMDAFTHLTNNTINGGNAQRATHAKGCWENCDLPTLQRYFQAEQAKLNNSTTSSSSSSTATSSAGPWDWSYVWNQIRHLTVQSLFLSPDYVRSGLNPSHRWSFELFGLDVLIDSTFRVHLCEWNSMPDVNSSKPSTQYHVTYPVDQRVKSQLLCDVFNILHFPAVDGRDPEVAAPTSGTNSFLGGFERLV